MTTLHDPEYERLHSERSARIVGEWLTTQAAPEPLVKEVVRLIVAHESGGWPEADLVQAADSLSFLDTNIDLFLGFARSGRFPVSAVRSKFHYTYERINVVEARTIARPLTDAALGRLADMTSIEYVYRLCAYLPLIGLLTAFLPDLDHPAIARAPATPDRSRPTSAPRLR